MAPEYGREKGVVIGPDSFVPVYPVAAVEAMLIPEGGATSGLPPVVVSGVVQGVVPLNQEMPRV